MKKEVKQFFENYKKFTDDVTSLPSQDLDAFIDRLCELEKQGINMARLDTAASGLAAESGEFAEIVKKMKFQGKDYNADEHFHMVRELGDALWYLMQACIALNVDPQDIIEENIRKLEKRYPGGKFDPYFSENREEGDI
jgi:NTP pyrophosphatase (non-canonical NTP hydrolase)